jgi:hypothetical protein
MGESIWADHPIADEHSGTGHFSQHKREIFAARQRPHIRNDVFFTDGFLACEEQNFCLLGAVDARWISLAIVNIKLTIEDDRCGFNHLVDTSLQQIVYFQFEGADAVVEMHFRYKDIERSGIAHVNIADADNSLFQRIALLMGCDD